MFSATYFLLLLKFSSQVSAYTKVKEAFQTGDNTHGDNYLCCAGQSTNCACNCSSSWAFVLKGECVCGEIPYSLLQCDSGNKIGLLACNCATFNEKEGTLEVGKCLYNCRTENYDVQTLSNNLAKLDVEVCGKDFNRTDTLCGKCKEGHYPLAYSYDMNCVKCPNSWTNWLKYFAVAYIPLTVFYFVIILFHVNVTSSFLTGFVTCCQTLSFPVTLRAIIMYSSEHSSIDAMVRWVNVFFSIWNLDFFRSLELNICLHTSTFQSLALDLAICIYPLLLILITYLAIHLYGINFRPCVVIWRPLSRFLHLFRSTLEIRTSLIDAFATFFFLSHVKFLSVSFDLLVPVDVYMLNSEGTVTPSRRLYYDASVVYFGEEHRPYAITAIMVLILFVMLPLLLMILYPFRWFQTILNFFNFRWYILHTFVDAFYGCYKDGTEPNSRDCRWFAPLFFLCRIFILSIANYFLNITYYTIVLMFLVPYIILLIVIKPFKECKKHLLKANLVFMLLLALWHASIVAADASVLNMTSFYFPALVGVSAYTLFLLILPFHIIQWIYHHEKFGAKQLMNCFHYFRNEYKQLE